MLMPVVLRAVAKPPPTVYLVRDRAPARPTWYAVHMTGPITKLTQAHLLAFRDRAHAEDWARGLQAYHDRHGAYPAREFAKWPKRVDWMDAAAGQPQESVDDDLDYVTPAPVPATALEVVPMPMADVLALTLGTGVGCRVVLDPRDLRRKIDVVHAFDKAATCTRLGHMLTMDLPAPPDVL